MTTLRESAEYDAENLMTNQADSSESVEYDDDTNPSPGTPLTFDATFSTLRVNVKGGKPNVIADRIVVIIPVAFFTFGPNRLGVITRDPSDTAIEYLVRSELNKTDGMYTLEVEKQTRPVPRGLT